MAKRLGEIPSLTPDQKGASAPEELAWVSASAGTGKTQVLTARVLRLLLHGVDPASILCLTFTKAGAAEMAQRIHERLAYWVRLKPPILARELVNLGESHAPEAVEGARSLFARVLDARGGGLRIQTIHAFAQSLLAAFPVEAGLVPGFRPLEEREELQLADRALTDLLVDAEAAGDGGLIGDIQALSRRMGEDDAGEFLKSCAGADEALAALPVPEMIEDELRDAFDVPRGDIVAKMAEWVSNEVFDIAALKTVAAANAAWGTKTGDRRVALIKEWLAADSGMRVETLSALRGAWITQGGTLDRRGKDKLDAICPGYRDICEGLDEAVAELVGMSIKAEFAAFAASGLRAGKRFAEAYGQAKRREGVVDFNDLIRKTRDLLAQPGIGDWVRYKLDQSIDHILVDEAQDTNADQWAIVRHLADEFFELRPDEEGKMAHRTIFFCRRFQAGYLQLPRYRSAHVWCGACAVFRTCCST